MYCCCCYLYRFVFMVCRLLVVVCWEISRRDGMGSHLACCLSNCVSSASTSPSIVPNAAAVFEAQASVYGMCYMSLLLTHGHVLATAVTWMGVPTHFIDPSQARRVCFQINSSAEQIYPMPCWHGTPPTNYTTFHTPVLFVVGSSMVVVEISNILSDLRTPPPSPPGTDF